ncbi:MAG: diacylglycerol kinase family lipid kinase [Bacteroidales bacterium]|nr:diacylglycerol kinase family lipid kinase [Candidatus Cacconaster caballi]
MIKTTWRVIVSRMSCAGKALNDWPSIAKLLASKGVSFSEKITDHAYHAIELAASAVKEGFRKIIVIGGDGAVHEVLNGVFSQSEVPTSEVTLAIIPVGSGNDWARLHNIPHDYERAVDLIASSDRQTRFQDVGCVHTMMDGKPYFRYMINIGGLGFDSHVCHRFDIAKSNGRAGDKQYLKCLLKSFLAYKCLKFKVKVDGRDFFSGPAFSVALGIGKYCGGGMMQTPGAVPDDGLIDVTVIRKMNKLRALVNIPRLFDGSVIKMKKLAFCTRARHIEIFASPYSYMEVDGEPVGITPVTVDIVPAAIKVVSALSF